MFWLPAAMSLAGTALGIGADAKARKKADYLNSPAGIRANAEAAGFNPLSFIGPGVGTGAQYAPTMGSTISNGMASAGALMGDAYNAQQQVAIQRSQLEVEQKRVEMLAQKMQINPTIGGVYAGKSGVGGGIKNAVIGATSEVAPDREFMAMPYSSGPGVTEISNAATGETPIVVPGADGEPWGIDEVATAVVVGAPQLAYNMGKNLYQNKDKITRKGITDFIKRQTDAKPAPPDAPWFSIGPKGGNPWFTW